MPLTRRSVLSRALALGCSAAASPLLTPVTFAAAPWENRLAVILLRGGMDGVGTVLPYGDADYVELRGAAALDSAVGPADLDGRFALHPALDPLMPLWRAGGLGFAHAVSTPYRGKRSHFDGQDLLEAGTATLASGRPSEGWLNRLLQVAGIGDPQTAFTLGHEAPILLAGAAPHSNWSPEVDLAMSPQAMDLARLVMSGDPAFGAALDQALELAEIDTLPRAGAGSAMAGDGMAGGGTGDGAGMMAPDKMAGAAAPRGTGHVALARYAGWQLSGPARIATFSLNGWDTHRRQDQTLTRSLKRLAETLMALKDELGPVWDKTAVLAVTEFGRTVRLNGTYGTDHGTGGALLFAGGALRGGQVVTDWPGLADGDLYQGRDLMPTRDLRAHAAWVLRDLFGLSVADLERSVFPGLDMGARSRLLL